MGNKIVLSLTVLLLLVSCVKDGGTCLSSTGNTESEIRALEAFTHLEVHGNINVEYYPNSKDFHVELSGGKHLLKGCLTRVSGNKLKIENANRCNWLRDYDKKITLKVYGNSLDSLSFYGAGNLDFKDTLHAQTFTFLGMESSGDVSLLLNNTDTYIKLSTGTTDVTLNGTSDFLYYYSLCQGFIYGEYFRCNNGFAVQKGYGDFYINPSSSLYVEIERTGNVYYPGNITVDQYVTGSGKLLRF